MSTFKNNRSLFFLLLVDIFSQFYSNSQWRVHAYCAVLFNSQKYRSRLKFNKPQVSCASLYSNSLTIIELHGFLLLGFILCQRYLFLSFISQGSEPATQTPHLLHHQIQQEILIKVLNWGNRVFRKNGGLRRFVSILNYSIYCGQNYFLILEFS